MFADICFPKNNESEFIKMAKNLGTRALLFIYTDQKDLKKKIEIDGEVKIFKGIISNKPRSSLPKQAAILISDEPKRNIIESKSVKLLFDFEKDARKDFMHYRNSGMNQVTAKIIKDKNKFYAFAFSSMIISSSCSRLLGRYRQNAKILNKFRCKTIIASFAHEPNQLRSFFELASLLRVIGLRQELVKSSRSCLYDYFQ